MPIFGRDKHEGTYRSGEWGGEPAIRPRIESGARIINGMETKRQEISFRAIFIIF